MLYFTPSCPHYLLFVITNLKNIFPEEVLYILCYDTCVCNHLHLKKENVEGIFLKNLNTKLLAIAVQS